MERIIIAAMAENGAIGKDNQLIWNLPDDMRFFKEQTKGSTVIMGRKNFESIPEKFRPLPNRRNLILSRNGEYQAQGSELFTDIHEALRSAKKEHAAEAYIIGGAEIYKLALKENVVDSMYLTRVDGQFEADAFFPEFDQSKWDVTVLLQHPTDKNHLFRFTIEKWTLKKDVLI